MSEDFSIIFWFKKHGVFMFIKFYLYGYLLLEFLFYVECILSFHESKNKICVIILFWYLITKLRKYKSLSMALQINSEVPTRRCSATLLKRDSKIFLWILWSFKNAHFVEHLRTTLLNHLIWDCIVPINISQ